MAENQQELKQIYRQRFGATSKYRNQVWVILANSFFNKWIPHEATVLDLGCGYGEFINNVVARKKFAMDLNPDSAKCLRSDVLHFEQDCSQPWPLAANSLDITFTSNFLEHLPDKQFLKRTLSESFRCLKPGGLIIAMGPNIKYLPGRYWDFFDHHVALTEASLGEALEMQGFALRQVTPRFLPYTLVRAPEYPLIFLRVYLKLPWLWRFVGRQFLMVATKPL